MIHENEEKNAVWTVFEGDIGELASLVTGFCESSYEICEFYEVSIERQRDGNYWKVHEFPSFDDRAVRAVENHLKARTDFVRVRFGGSESDYELDCIVCDPRNSEQLARYVSTDELEEIDEDSFVVLCVERKAEGIRDEQRQMLEKIGEK